MRLAEVPEAGRFHRLGSAAMTFVVRCRLKGGGAAAPFPRPKRAAGPMLTGRQPEPVRDLVGPARGVLSARWRKALTSWVAMMFRGAAGSCLELGEIDGVHF